MDKRRNFILKKSFLLTFTLFLLFAFTYKNTSYTTALTTVDNIPFFDGSTFTLEYFWVNGVQEDLELDVVGGGSFNPPTLEFTLNNNTNQLDMNGGLYCNGIGGYYNYTDTYLEITNGGTTLTVCPTASTQEERFLFIVNPLLDSSTTNNKVFYEITADLKGLWLWGDDVNEKLFFTKNVLNVAKLNLGELVKIYPNPAQDYIEIETNNIVIFNISIFDINGKQLFSENRNNKKIDISKLNKGLYFIKIKTNKATITKKLILR